MIKIHGVSSEDTSILLKNALGKLVPIYKGQVLTDEDFNNLIIKNGKVLYTVDNDPTMYKTDGKPKKWLSSKPVEKVITEDASSPSAAEVLLRTKTTRKK